MPDETRNADDATESPSEGLRAIVVEYDDQPDECTIYPAGTRGVDRMTTWITAREGGFVDLCRMR